MILLKSTQFQKDFKKLSLYQKEKVFCALDIFIQNPFDPRLRNHKLQGEFIGCFSLKADYDLRIICKYENDKMYTFLIAVGKHDDVY